MLSEFLGPTWPQSCNLFFAVIRSVLKIDERLTRFHAFFLSLLEAMVLLQYKHQNPKGVAKDKKVLTSGSWAKLPDIATEKVNAMMLIQPKSKTPPEAVLCLSPMVSFKWVFGQTINRDGRSGVCLYRASLFAFKFHVRVGF